MKLIKLLLSGALTASGLICAQSSTYSTAPIGFNKVVCLTNSDTIVGVPFRQQGSLSSLLSASPAVVPGFPDLAEIPLQISTLTPGGLGQHYVKFEGGTRDGRWYDITANTASSATINLNGDTLDGVVEGDRVVITQYWTLDTLFPPDQATTGWTENLENPGEWIQNGHAIMASTSTLGSGRRTEILLPNLTAEGINIPSEGRYYIHNGIWKRSSSGNTSFDNTIIYPDTHFRISHPSSVTYTTTFRSAGEVEMSVMSIPLSTRQTTSQDNYIALGRPVSVTLNDLNLLGTDAFVSSTNTLGSGRQDELLVFDNALQLRNKAPSARFFVHNGIWKLSGGGNTDRGGELIDAGLGIIIRKSTTLSGSTVFWTNTPSY